MNARHCSPTPIHVCASVAIVVSAMATLNTGCDRNRVAPESRAWPTMGTMASVSVPHDQTDRIHAAVSKSQRIFEDINDQVTVWRDDSEIAELNRAAGGDPLSLSSNAFRLLELSLEYAQLSGGAFDPTIAPLIRAWGFSGGTAPGEPLDPATIRQALARTGYQHIVLTNNSARLELPGMSVDLGGIAKGYAVDQAYEQLRGQGYHDLMVNLGGNMRCGGNGRRGTPWTIGVRHPFDNDAILGTVFLTGGSALATSGNYERFVTIDGRRYAHIIDPRNGQPVAGMAGVTVLCPTAVEADALSTAFFVLGRKATCDILQQKPRCHVLMVEDRQPMTIFVSPGFQARFSPLPEFADAVRPIQ